MESDNVAMARAIVNRYPEVFESLLEFERTKKIPKLYHRQRLNITIDENVLRDFKTYCEKRNLNMSRIVEEKMTEEMGKSNRWDNKKQ